MATSNGCASERVVFVTEGAPIWAGPNTIGQVWYMDPSTGQRVLSEQPQLIPEGWIIVSPGWEE